MPSDPRRANAVTALAIVLAVLLAFVWLGSSGDPGPAVPAGLTPASAAPAAHLPSAGEAGKVAPGRLARRSGRGRSGEAQGPGGERSTAPPAKRRARGDAHAPRPGGRGGQGDAVRGSVPGSAAGGGGAGSAFGEGGGASGPSAPEFAIG